MEEVMFADSLLESAPHLGHRSAWTKLASVLLQSLALAVALAIPMFHVERLQFIAPPPSIQMTSLQQPVTRSQAIASSNTTSAALPTPFVQPRYIPSTTSRTDNRVRETGPVGPPAIPCIVHCGAGAQTIANLFRDGAAVIPPQPPRPSERPVRVSEMQLGGLIHKVVPDYPIIAKQLGVQGAVLLTALVGKHGRVERVQSVSGPPLLVLSAKHAVEQWQYRPYLLNREPVEVQTQITVNFVLNRD
jgi:protein TonB